MTKICVWRTHHEIADTVADAVLAGLPKHFPDRYDYFSWHAPDCVENKTLGNIQHADIHIGYGILRGMTEVFRECDRQGKPWFNIDKGYWGPGHYDGYYRVSLRGTQQTSSWPAPDLKRWGALGLTIDEPVKRDNYDMLCPQTQHVEKFFGSHCWPVRIDGKRCFVRHKEQARSLDDDLSSASRVVTFNSSVGWEALRRGIPCESDPEHSIVGAWQAVHGYNKCKELFATMAALQLTLDEMRQGFLWPLMQKLLTTH